MKGFLQLLGRLIKTGVLLALCAAVVAVVALRLQDMHREAERPLAEPGENAEDRVLFRELLDAGLLTPREDGSLAAAPPDMLLVRRARILEQGGAVADPPDLERQRRLLRGLYGSPVGALVQEQVRLWNGTRRLAAIRDDRPRPEGSAENAWQAFNEDGHPLRPTELVPDTFGFVHGGTLMAGLSDWLAVSRREPVVFATEIATAAEGSLTLQVIGKPIAVPEGAKVDTRVDEPNPDCPAQPEASVIRIPVKPATTPKRLTVTVEPSVHCAALVGGLAIRLQEDDSGAYSRYGWRPIRRSRPANRFQIATGDGVPLTDAAGEGRPTEEAYRLGLVPIVGFGRGDTFSLSGLLSGARLDGAGSTARLTIDGTLQAAAQEAVEWGVAQFPENDRYASERKSAVVVLDADSGAILAAANYPAVPGGARPWDYAAFSRAFPLRDPSSVLGWEIIDRHSTPGSTYKPLTALSAMRTEAGLRARLSPILHGLEPGPLKQVTGLDTGQSAYTPTPVSARSISNFAGAALGRYIGRPTRSAGVCDVEAPPSPTFGLVQAVQFSINVWFARLAVMREEVRLQEFYEDILNRPTDYVPQAPVTGQIETARALGIDDRARMDLGFNLPPGLQLPRYNDATGADVLYAQLPKSAMLELDLPPGNPESVRNLLVWVAALNGIGQSVSVSPLHMATVASTIATGRRVRPHLLAAIDGTALPVSEGDSLDLDAELLSLLRAGMKAVPEVGTATRAFADRPDLRCRAFGKTGTAEIDVSKAFNSAWFIGWLQPATPSERRLAFACMTTHAHGARRTGGGACAPVIARMLDAVIPPPAEDEASVEN